MIKGKCIVIYTKTQRIKWWGHLNRREGMKLVKAITYRNSLGIRTKGRPKSRRSDEVINDLKKLKRRNWIQLFKDRIVM